MESINKYTYPAYIRDSGYGYIRIVAWVLLLTGCFKLVLFSHQAFIYLFFAILAFFVFKDWEKPVLDKKWYLFYALGVLGSCIYSMIYNDQNPIRTAVNSYQYLGLFSIFLFYHYSPTYKQADKAILVVSLIWCACYLMQWIVYPITIFVGATDEVNISSNMFRMRMPGSICAYCIFLYGINRWMTNKSLINLGYSLLGLIPIFIMGFRSLTAAVVLCAFIMIGVISKKFWRTLLWMAIAVVLGYGALSVPIIGDKLEEMIERNDDDQTFENEDYIRYFEYDYYSGEFFTKPGEKFFGAGAPVYGKSPYADKMKMAEERFGYYWVDLGLVGLSWIIGIPAVLCLLIILWKGIRRCRAPENQYLRFTIIATTLASVITSMEIFREGNLIIIGLFLYTIAAYNRDYEDVESKPGDNQ